VTERDPDPVSGSNPTAASALPAAAPILDWQTAVRRMGNGNDLLHAVAATFHVECAALLEEARAALAAGDAQRLRRAAHTLKGAAGVFCAQPAAEAARTVEQLADAGDLAAAAAAWPVAEHAMAQLLAALAARGANQS
jgi:HPt (histidine-containing phosphotransfer) domain-containing protein